MAKKATIATAAPSRSGWPRSRSTTSAANALSSTATPTARQLRATLFGKSTMLVDTAPLTTSAATCSPATSVVSCWMQPMPSATSRPLRA